MLSKKILSQISLLREIQELEIKLKKLVKKDNYWKKTSAKKEENFLIEIIKEFPNSNICSISDIALLLGFPGTMEFIRRKLWSLIDRGTIYIDSSRNLSAFKNKKEI